MIPEALRTILAALASIDARLATLEARYFPLGPALPSYTYPSPCAQPLPNWPTTICKEP